MHLFWFSVRVREVHQDQKGLKEIKGQKLVVFYNNIVSFGWLLFCFVLFCLFFLYLLFLLLFILKPLDFNIKRELVENMEYLEFEEIWVKR